MTRESIGDDGVWRQAPPHARWRQVRAAGVDVHMIGLRRDDLIVSRFPGRPAPGTVLHVGVVADQDEIADVRGRLPSEVTIEVDRPAALTFLEPWAFRWQLSGSGFVGAGDARGEWLDLA